MKLIGNSGRVLQLGLRFPLLLLLLLLLLFPLKFDVFGVMDGWMLDRELCILRTAF